MTRTTAWIMVALACLGCDGPHYEEVTFKSPVAGTRIVRIRGCEYAAHGNAFCHAGDCDNPTHRTDTSNVLVVGAVFERP